MYRIYNEIRAEGDFACWPGYDLIKQDTGMSAGKIKRGLAKLEETRWIKIEKHFKREGQGNVYTLSSPFVQFSQNGNSAKQEPRISQNEHYDSPG
jgi:hypothetical protein